MQYLAATQHGECLAAFCMYLVWHAELVLILIAQFSRYRSDYSPLQRQQTKWILFGGCIVVIIDVGLIVPQDIFPALGQAGSFYQLVTAPQSLLGGLTFIRGNQLAIIASTFLTGALFKPLHDRTRALIDRPFYRRKYDAARTLATFSVTIRDEVDLDQLCTKLAAVVQETMQPAHVSLWLCPPKHSSEKTTRALPVIED